jgi:hypothetical protein
MLIDLLTQKFAEWMWNVDCKKKIREFFLTLKKKLFVFLFFIFCEIFHFNAQRS